MWAFFYSILTCFIYVNLSARGGIFQYLKIWSIECIILPEFSLLKPVLGILLYIVFTISHNAILSCISIYIEYVS